MDRKKMFFGVVMIMAGVLIGLKSFHLVPEVSMLFILAGGFGLAYFVFNRNIGFLIPGCILAAIATFTTLEETIKINGLYFLLLLGLAFIAIFLIHTMHLRTDEWGKRFWPLFPGAILFVIGTLILGGQAGISDPERKVINLILPVFLIALGLIVLFGRTKKSS